MAKIVYRQMNAPRELPGQLLDETDTCIIGVGHKDIK